MIPYIPVRTYTETVRDTMATKKDEDADLVVEIGITAESPSTAG